MRVGVVRIDLGLHGCRSLKEKRQILRSVIERTRARYRVAVAEIEDQDLWQRAVIGVSSVSANGGHAAEIMQSVVDFVTTAHPECEVLDHEIEVLAPFG